MPVKEDEQLQLLEVSHPAAKKIMPIARAYKKASQERQELSKKEIELKEKLREALRDCADLKPDGEGVISFRCGKVVVTMKPRDELIRVREEDDEGE